MVDAINKCCHTHTTHRKEYYIYIKYLLYKKNLIYVIINGSNFIIDIQSDKKINMEFKRYFLIFYMY